MNKSELRYPRPDFDRSATWQSLDGPWQFARGQAEHAEEAMLAADSEYPERILVPFPWGSQRSGVEANWLDQGWYRRTIEVPEEWGVQRTILHFGGIHYRARIFLNGWLVGDHVGAGPFECDLASSLQGRSGDLVVAVDAPVDKRAIGHGKQRCIPADDYDSCAFQP